MEINNSPNTWFERTSAMASAPYKAISSVISGIASLCFSKTKQDSTPTASLSSTHTVSVTSTNTSLSNKISWLFFNFRYSNEIENFKARLPIWEANKETGEPDVKLAVSQQVVNYLQNGTPLNVNELGFFKKPEILYPDSPHPEKLIDKEINRALDARKTAVTNILDAWINSPPEKEKPTRESVKTQVLSYLEKGTSLNVNNLGFFTPPEKLPKAIQDKIREALDARTTAVTATLTTWIEGCPPEEKTARESVKTQVLSYLEKGTPLDFSNIRCSDHPNLTEFLILDRDLKATLKTQTQEDLRPTSPRTTETFWSNIQTTSASIFSQFLLKSQSLFSSLKSYYSNEETTPVANPETLAPVTLPETPSTPSTKQKKRVTFAAGTKSDPSNISTAPAPTVNPETLAPGTLPETPSKMTDEEFYQTLNAIKTRLKKETPWIGSNPSNQINEKIESLITNSSTGIQELIKTRAISKDNILIGCQIHLKKECRYLVKDSSKLYPPIEEPKPLQSYILSDPFNEKLFTQISNITKDDVNGSITTIREINDLSHNHKNQLIITSILTQILKEPDISKRKKCIDHLITQFTPLANNTTRIQRISEPNVDQQNSSCAAFIEELQKLRANADNPDVITKFWETLSAKSTANDGMVILTRRILHNQLIEKKDTVLPGTDKTLETSLTETGKPWNKILTQSTTANESIDDTGLKLLFEYLGCGKLSEIRLDSKKEAPVTTSHTFQQSESPLNNLDIKWLTGDITGVII